MTDPNNCYAYFSVYGDDIDPSTLTQKLGVEPTQAWQKGDLDPRHRERSMGHWSLYSRLDRTAELEEHLHDVLLQMDGSSEAFASVADRFGGIMRWLAISMTLALG